SYLVNMYGDVPLVLSTAYAKNDTISRMSVDGVYKQIISDLQDADSLLLDDYSISGGKRIRANKGAAIALLARAYLYQRKWAQAETVATSVIENSLYKLVPDLNGVFLVNSQEAILQWQILQSVSPWATLEGYTLIPELLTSDFDSLTVAQYWQYFIPKYCL